MTARLSDIKMETPGLPFLPKAAPVTLLLITLCAILFAVGGLRIANPPITATVSVRSGDTIWGLAQTYGDPDEYILERVDRISRANGLEKGEPLQPGQTLVIPVSGKRPNTDAGGQYACR